MNPQTHALEVALFYLEHLTEVWEDAEYWRWAELMGEAPVCRRIVGDVLRKALGRPTAAEEIAAVPDVSKEERQRMLGIKVV